jgi:hypothetical protein
MTNSLLELLATTENSVPESHQLGHSLGHHFLNLLGCCLLVSTVNAKYQALGFRARLLEGKACKALQVNCKAPQGSVRLCEAVLKTIIKAYEDIRLWELSIY